MLSHFSCVWLCVTPWTVAHQAPLSMGFSRQKYWSGLPCSSPGNLPNPGIKPTCLKSPALAGRFFTTSVTWEANQGNRKEVILRWSLSSCLLDNLVIYGEEENLRREELWVTNKIMSAVYVMLHWVGAQLKITIISLLFLSHQLLVCFFKTFSRMSPSLMISSPRARHTSRFFYLPHSVPGSWNVKQGLVELEASG